MRVLVSNDDGVEAPGIRVLAQRLGAFGEVTVVAPDRDRSGASNSVTLDLPIRVARLDDGRYNILLLGADSGRDRVGTRPDSIQLASIDADTGSAVTFGFSRDTENINFRPGSTMARLMPAGWNCGDECLLNGLYTWAQDNAAKFPAGTQSPGVLATREAVEALSGLDI